MNELAAGLPSGAHVFVSSIPDVYQLWQLFHTNLAAELVWSAAGICQSMLSLSNTEADRQAVLAREEALNAVLATVCGQYSFGRFDNDATFRLRLQHESGEQARLLPPQPQRPGRARLVDLAELVVGDVAQRLTPSCGNDTCQVSNEHSAPDGFFGPVVSDVNHSASPTLMEGGLPVSELAGRYGASAEQETTDPDEAYVGYEPSRIGRPSYWDRLPRA